jgi:hypothetical protein
MMKPGIRFWNGCGFLVIGGHCLSEVMDREKVNIPPINSITKGRNGEMTMDYNP